MYFMLSTYLREIDWPFLTEFGLYWMPYYCDFLFKIKLNFVNKSTNLTILGLSTNFNTGRQLQ